jgi:hypothetical protein
MADVDYRMRCIGGAQIRVQRASGRNGVQLPATDKEEEFIKAGVTGELGLE